MRTTRSRWSTAANAALALSAIAACKGNGIGSLKPTSHFTGRLLQPLLHDSEVIAVEIHVPEGYTMQLGMGPGSTLAEVDFLRHASNSDPEITLLSTGVSSVDLGSGVQPPQLFGSDCAQRADQSHHVERREARADGWLLVCASTSNAGDSFTDVVRDVRWEGADYQCDVTFKGEPTKAQIADSIAVCDSMKLRHLTTDDNEMEWDGTKWYRRAK